MKYIKEFNNYNRMNENSSEIFYKKVENDLHEILDFIQKYYSNLNYNDLIITLTKECDQIYNFIETDFPRGLQNIPDPVKLYRILKVNNIKDIRKGNLGKHYIGDINIINDEFLTSIGISTYDYHILYIVEITTPLLNIDVYRTIYSKFEFPKEYEYTINDVKNIEIVNITKFEKENEIH